MSPSPRTTSPSGSTGGSRASLDSLSPGHAARLVRIGGERPFRRRLMELGLLPGTELRLIRRADVGGVLEIEVRGCRVTVRRGEARLIEVDPA